MIFFLGNNIQSSLNSTGAFEIFIDNKLVFSKLEMNRMPNMNEIVAIFEENGMEFKWSKPSTIEAKTTKKLN